LQHGAASYSILLHSNIGQQHFFVALVSQPHQPVGFVGNFASEISEIKISPSQIFKTFDF